MAKLRDFSKKRTHEVKSSILYGILFAFLWSIGVYLRYSFPSTRPKSSLRIKSNFVEVVNNTNTNDENHLHTKTTPYVGSSESSSTNLKFTKEYLKTLAPDVFGRVPTNFLDNFRNPCWMEGEQLLCLPYFYVIGFHKCGSSDVFGKVACHPNVVRVPKEPHWWSLKRIRIRKQLQRHKGIKNTSSSLDWYLKVYGNKTFLEIKTSTLKMNNSNGTWTTFHPKVFGDGSVSNIARVIYTRWGFSEDPESLPYLLHALQPQAKIIITVRDPVSRFKSMYYRKVGKNPEHLHQFAESDVQCATDCLAKRDVRHCAYHSSCHKSPQIYMGIYVAFIKHWTSVYGFENILIVRMEDRFTDPVGEYKKMLQYLDLENLPDDQCNRIVSGPAVNRNRGEHIMLNETIKLLRKFYKPYNKELSEFMNDEKYLFGY